MRYPGSTPGPRWVLTPPGKGGEPAGSFVNMCLLRSAPWTERGAYAPQQGHCLEVRRPLEKMHSGMRSQGEPSHEP